MTTQSLAAPDAPMPYRELSLVLSMQLAYGFCWSMFLLLPKYLTVELHASATQIGLIAAIPSTTGALAVPFVGRLLDRNGRRPMILIGSALCALQAFAFSAVHAIGPLLCLLQLLYGLSFVIAFNGAAAHAADLAPPARLSQVIGVFGAANVAMNAVAPAIGEPLASAYGWKPVFLLSGALGVVACLLALRIRDVPRPSPSPRSAHTRRNRAALRAYVLSMCGVGAAFSAAFAFYQPFAIGLGIHRVRDFFFGYAASVVVARVLLGSLPDRFGRKRSALVAIALYALVEVGMTQLVPGTLALFGALFGCAHGFFYPAVTALAVEHSDPSERGLVMAYINGGFQIGYTAGVLLFGWVAERAGYPPIYLLAGAILAITFALLARFDPAGHARSPE